MATNKGVWLLVIGILVLGIIIGFFIGKLTISQNNNNSNNIRYEDLGFTTNISVTVLKISGEKILNNGCIDELYVQKQKNPQIYNGLTDCLIDNIEIKPDGYTIVNCKCFGLKA